MISNWSIETGERAFGVFNFGEYCAKANETWSPTQFGNYKAPNEMKKRAESNKSRIVAFLKAFLCRVMQSWVAREEIENS